MPTPRVSQTVKALADQDIHRNAAVLCLAFDGVIVRQRVRFGHPGGRKHAIGFPAAGLLKIIDDATGSLFAELLVEFRGACRIGVTHNKQQGVIRSEEHTSELQSLMRISYAGSCLKKKKSKKQYQTTLTTIINK